MGDHLSLEEAEAVAGGIDGACERILSDGVVVCLRLSAGPSPVEACHAAARGGLRVFEITLTTPGALEVIAALSRDRGLLVGAGTVLSPADVEEIARAGARFAMSPVFDETVVEAAHRRGLVAIPGAATPREILQAHRGGADLVKVFPARALGGPGYLRTLRGPLPEVPLLPTSGPESANMAEYVAAGAVAVGVGREIFPEGFTLEGVEGAARRVRAAMEEARRKAGGGGRGGALGG